MNFKTRVFAAVLGVSLAAHAQELNLDVYAGEKPNDIRLGELKDLNGYFPFAVPDSKEEWESRAEKIRRRILVSCGLWPMPELPAVNATIHGKVDREDYTVEKVYFESFPGLYVTGNLYRPKGKTERCPVALSPHGHWKNGRFYDGGLDEVQKQFRRGAEWDLVGGRYPLQARCVQLARMGCVVFHYDMLGYADSRPISYELAHRHREPRPELESENAWGLFTAQAEMRLQNVFGMQTLNSLRAVDFVTSLPDVDPDRIGVTGASGGGTQTMILAAIDPRITVSFPAVMVSTAMQGGCTCENATCLRVGTGNVEFAALFAPKPQGINPANDWTKELATKGLPELKQLYKLLGAEQNIEAYTDLVYFPHNFNHPSRQKMYDWMNRHLKLKIEDPIIEKKYEPLTEEEMTVWNDQHPSPEVSVEAEIELLREMAKTSEEQLKNADSTMLRSALETLADTSWDGIGSVEREEVDKTDVGNYWLFKDILRTSSSELPVIFIYPKNWNQKVVVLASDSGKDVLKKESGDLTDEVAGLLDRGHVVAAADLFQQGEFLNDTGALKQTRKVGNDRDFAGYTFGYNRTLLGHRVHDLLTLLRFIRDSDRRPKQVHLVSRDGATPYVAVAGALAGNHVDKVLIEDADFRFAKIRSWRDPNFLPGAVKYGDLPGILKLVESVETKTE